ncbi:hypothetical protein BJX63DRAFT_272028 [Aspergillus granulosus]|uniref:Uncharacterized protein n=1 Tax=Aspergillus granulosus TaxID=176169 RepID=A0ABR4H899_9EURO
MENLNRVRIQFGVGKREETLSVGNRTYHHHHPHPHPHHQRNHHPFLHRSIPPPPPPPSHHPAAQVCPKYAQFQWRGMLKQPSQPPNYLYNNRGRHETSAQIKPEDEKQGRKRSHLRYSHAVLQPTYISPHFQIHADATTPSYPIIYFPSVISSHRNDCD